MHLYHALSAAAFMSSLLHCTQSPFCASLAAMSGYTQCKYRSDPRSYHILPHLGPINMHACKVGEKGSASPKVTIFPHISWALIKALSGVLALHVAS